jgi:hypothetical protein
VPVRLSTPAQAATDAAPEAEVVLNVVDAPPAGEARPPPPPRRFDALDCVPRSGDARPDAFALRLLLLLLLALFVPFGGVAAGGGGGADGEPFADRAGGTFRLIAHHPSSSLAIWTTSYDDLRQRC